MTRRIYQAFIEKFKYLTALFQVESHRLAYLKAAFQYGFGRKILFPETIVRLRGSRFAARKNSMDIAHLSNYFEPQTTAFLLKLAPKQFIDVGAHVGRYSVLLAQSGTSVIAFEPNGGNYQLLQQNIRLNQLADKITTLNLGCSNVAQERELFCVPSNEGMASFIKRDGAETKEVCTLKTLDEACGDLAAVDAIKIDVEGLELEVLQGAVQLLAKNSTLLIVEIFGAQKEKEISAFLNPFGYSVKGILDSRNYYFVKGTPQK